MWTQSPRSGLYSSNSWVQSSTSSQTPGEGPEELLPGTTGSVSGSQARAKQGWAAMGTVGRTGQSLGCTCVTHPHSGGVFLGRWNCEG